MFFFAPKGRVNCILTVTPTWKTAMGLSSPTMLWGWRIQPGIPTKTRKTQIAPGSGTNHDVKRQISSWPISLTLHDHHHVSLSICHHLNHNLCWLSYHLHKLNPVFCMRFMSLKSFLPLTPPFVLVCFGWNHDFGWWHLHFSCLNHHVCCLNHHFPRGSTPPGVHPTIFPPGNVTPRYKNLHVQIRWAK